MSGATAPAQRTERGNAMPDYRLISADSHVNDPGLQADCFRVYNDGLAEFVSYDPKHMAGLAMISLYDPKAGARELERCAKLGLKGAMIWCSPPQEQPYSSDIYDPFWGAAQE